jgi:meso-butanediol dehydrogenase/(S,S)-butanediol dehydrogenase/diacetyl reductase
VTITVSYRFDDAVVLITGAGSGIGAALARHCAREGAAVIAVDRRHDALLGGLGAAARGRIDLRTVDVADEAAVAALIGDVRKQYARLDAAVLGAAIQYRSDLAEMSSAQWREVIDVNLNGVFYCLQGVIPVL